MKIENPALFWGTIGAAILYIAWSRGQKQAQAAQILPTSPVGMASGGSSMLSSSVGSTSDTIPNITVTPNNLSSSQGTPS